MPERSFGDSDGERAAPAAPARGCADAHRTHETAHATVERWTSPVGGANDGGDWCETVALTERETGVTLGDVAGHGDPVAPMKALVRDAMVSAMQRLRVPADVLAAGNAVVFADPREAIVTALVGFFDGGTRVLTFANAGHPPPLLVVPGGHRFLTGPPADLPLGIFRTHASSNIAVTLPPGAFVVLYTDGVTERGRDPLTGERDLVAAARHAFDRPQQHAAHAIAEHVFARGRGGDDAAVLVLRTPAESERLRHARAAPA